MSKLIYKPGAPDEKAKGVILAKLATDGIADLGTMTIMDNVASLHAMRRVPTLYGSALRYTALWDSLDLLAALAKKRGEAVHIDKQQFIRANAKWHVVSPLLETALCDQGVEAVVFDTEKENP